jgi:hypothetical protein
VHLLPGLFAGPDEDFVDRHPAVTGDDVGDRVGDVFGLQRLRRAFARWRRRSRCSIR